ncbi:hypothetical protein FIV41_20970 [Pseudomonas marginalis]|uniref:Uncharacterized protein n=1 Tax=Pseudomonas marginalis TaxID=298 RepID=A0A9X9BP88_PSEMA|nr:hypothetical protein [Pseudomonas marginalis]TWR55592.1 hypothetical protein FIV41_20970 [Pseudomonas marginalis]SEC23940.1 hypothetical protein SAMN04490193_2248 [Pseudomonas marginalis]
MADQTSIEALASYAGELSEAAAKAQAASELQRKILNGDAQTDVLTESGPVPTFAKQARLYQEAMPDAVADLSAQMADGKVYATVALGLAATANNQSFYVEPASPTMSRSLYVRVSATEARHVSDDPSLGAVSELGTRTAAVESGTFSELELRFIRLGVESGYVWALVDSAGRMALGCKIDGSMVGKFVLRDGTVNRTTLNLDLDGFIAKALDPETGYVWAVTDTQGRIGLALRLDGTVTGKFLLGTGAVLRAALGADLSGYIAVQLSPESGYVWAVVDSVGRIALGITTAGKTVGNFDVHIPDVTGIEYLKPLVDLLCVGDSLTANSSQVTWREQLAPLISARTIVNGGIGGQTSRQIAARFGAGCALLTVTGNQIPASGSVAVTALSTLPLSTPATNSGTFTLKGTLGGIQGTLTCEHSEAGDESDAYTFTRDAAGEARYSAPRSPFVPDVPGEGFYTQIIWMGRNNLDNVEQIKSDIRAMVGVQKTAEKRYLIITPPLGGNPTPGASTGEGVGTSTYNNCVALEDWATTEYGDRVIKIREWLMQFNNGSADDLDDVAKGVVPRSLRLDIIHNTTISNGHIARRIAYEINRRSW